MRCQLCGFEYDAASLACHSHCPLAEGCHIICCPNCGYQVVDTGRSGTVNLLRRLRDRVRGQAAAPATFPVDRVPLSELPAGASGEIAAIDEADTGRLMKLAALGLAPGSRLRLQQRRPAFVVWVDETQLSLDSSVAARIYLRP